MGGNRRWWVVLLVAVFTATGAAPLVLAGVAEGEAGWTASATATVKGKTGKVFPHSRLAPATAADATRPAVTATQSSPSASPAPSPTPSAAPSPGPSHPPNQPPTVAPSPDVTP